LNKLHDRSDGGKYFERDHGENARGDPMKMSVGVLDHYNVSTRKLNKTVQFYENVLGFINGPRPPFNFAGAWLYSAGHPVLHLNDISQTDKQQRPDSGASIMSRSGAAASRR
jgi:hypothetical protein